MLRRLLAIALFFCALSPPLLAGEIRVVAAEEVGMSAERLNALRNYFQAQIDHGVEPGVQVLVARRGQVVMHENFGVANIETGEALTDDTLFRIYSMTKPITNVVAMTLYEEGRFAMSDPLAKFVPQFAGLQVFTGVDENGAMILADPEHPPTMHELMTHTAGFTYGGVFGDSPVDARFRELNPLEFGIGRDEVLNRMAQVPLAYQPGSEYLYSLSTDILGMILEIIAGQELGDLMQERVFDPLDMNETFVWVPENLQSRLMPIHTFNEERKLVLMPPDWNQSRPFDHATVEPDIVGGGFQLTSTTDDYFRFAQMLLNGGTLEGERVLSPSTVRFMTSQRYPAAVRDRYWAPGQGHGLNVSVVVDPSLIDYPVNAGEFSHGGLANGYFFVDPSEELVFIMQGQLIPPLYRDVHLPIINGLVHAAIIDPSPP